MRIIIDFFSSVVNDFVFLSLTTLSSLFERRLLFSGAGGERERERAILKRKIR